MKKVVKNILAPVVIIVLAALFRVIPHMPNFAPITAMALFGGVYLGRRYALLVPLLVMLLSDYLLLYVNPFGAHMFRFNHLYPPQALWYGTPIIAVYGSFLISSLIGLWLKTHKNITNIIFATLIASIQFFLITNTAVWINGMYDRSLLGLWESYIAGIPFFRWTVAGDFFYTGVFFGAYELIAKIVFATNLLRRRPSAYRTLR